MKKFLIFVLAFLALGGLCYAENGAITYTSNPQVGELKVYVEAYNNSGASITSNAVVILDTTAANVASGSTLGCRINTTATAGLPIFGVTDQVIANGTAGRVCVRGPHLVQFTADAGAPVAGASLATTTTAGYFGPLVNAATTGPDKLPVAYLLSATRWNDESIQGRRGVDGVPTQLYWVWIR